MINVFSRQVNNVGNAAINVNVGIQRHSICTIELKAAQLIRRQRTKRVEMIVSMLQMTSDEVEEGR